LKTAACNLLLIAFAFGAAEGRNGFRACASGDGGRLVARLLATCRVSLNPDCQHRAGDA
jgi:hypothetical protein